MILPETKKEICELIDEAVISGARVKQACLHLGISHKSYLRWKDGKLNDLRKGASKNVNRKLTTEEQEQFYQTANSKRFRGFTPGQIVATLLQEEIYYGSERTLYRILKSRNALVCRTESKPAVKRKRPLELHATGPNQVYSWDITWLKTEVRGIFLFAYVVIDIFSRKIVGWTIEDRECPELARTLFERIIRDQKVRPQFVHSDNGGPMKGISLVAFLTQMQVNLSYSRPRVSDDNPFSEALFRTLKYHVSYPKVFRDMDHAREWFSDFVFWYNTRHLHSGIGYVTPDQKHRGEDLYIFEKRQRTLDAAARRNPERFVNGQRSVMPDREVVLNKAA